MPEPHAPRVRFLDLKAAYRELKPELDDAWTRVMESGWYLLGDELGAFEREFASFVGTDQAVGVGSGLDALTLALRAFNVGPGDEVIVPSHTFIASWLAVSAAGATPVPAEPILATANLDPVAVERALTDRTRAVMPVHLYGQPADMGPIEAIARAKGVPLIVDAAQAHGATYQGRPVGTIGDAVCWSFYPGKNLGAFGDAGAVTTDDVAVADRLRSLRNYGSRVRYVNDERGVNSRMDELQAAVLRVKLARLPEWNERRAAVAGRYLEALVKKPDLVLPRAAVGCNPSWHLFVVRSPDRDRLQANLGRRGVETLIHYPIPPHRQEAYRDRSAEWRLPVAEQLADEVLSLPIGPHLSQRDVDQVIDAVISIT